MMPPSYRLPPVRGDRHDEKTQGAWSKMEQKPPQPELTATRVHAAPTPKALANWPRRRDKTPSRIKVAPPASATKQDFPPTTGSFAHPRLTFSPDVEYRAHATAADDDSMLVATESGAREARSWCRLAR